MDSSRWIRLVAVAGAIGLAVRLAFGLGYWTDKPLTRDEREYLSLARSLAAGQGFVYDEVIRAERIDPFGRAPGYPVFLAAVGGGAAVTPAVPTAVKIAQSIVGVLGIVMVAVLARRLAGPRAGIAAAAIAAVYPPLAWTSAYALSEALYWPIGLVVAWAFDRACATSGNAQPRWSAIAGVLAGIATLIRPATVVFVGIALLWLLFKRQTARALILGLAAAATIAPWTMRNYATYHRFVLVAPEGGVTFWTGNHPLAIGEGDLATNVDLKLAKQRLRDLHPQLSEEQMEPIYYNEAFGWIAAHPGAWLALEARKLFYTVVPTGPSYRVHSRLYFLGSALSYAIVLILALAGLRRLGPRRALIPGLWLMAASAILVCLVFFPQERFRQPVIDPALIVCAAALWAERRGAETPTS